MLARQREEQELIRTKEALELKSRELAHSLALTRATLESTWDGILVTDERGTVTDFNRRYVEMWRVPPAIMDSREHRQILEHASGQFDDGARFRGRIEEIYAASPEDSFDVLALADGRVFERYSRIQFVEHNVGRVWSFRDITDTRRTEEKLRDESRILELQVHGEERPGSDPARAGELAGRDHRRRHGHRHQARVPPARLRPLPPGGRLPEAYPPRAWASASPS